jgi:hypothetical protein
MLWNQLNYITTVQVHDLIDLFRNALLVFLIPSADRASMDRKSRILIVSFFNYIQDISHGKVGGKVGKGRIPLVIKSLSPSASVHDNFK